jgi:hypothetical protein
LLHPAYFVRPTDCPWVLALLARPSTPARKGGRGQGQGLAAGAGGRGWRQGQGIAENMLLCCPR